MERDQLLTRVDSGWHAFDHACEGLSEGVLQEPGVVEGWSVKDLWSHIATWEEESIAALNLMMQGKRPGRYARYGGVDAFNHRQWLRSRGAPLWEVQRRFRETHARLMAFLADVPTRHYATETRFRHRLRLDTYGHYPEHCRQVVIWRQAKGL